jgi:hypothetical protein
MMFAAVRESEIVLVLDAGNDETVRALNWPRPKSAKARSRGRLGTGLQRAMWI